jgi:ParB family chromosome partitioning protein
VVDGYKRVRALRRLGHDVVRAAAWESGGLEALLLERALRGGDAVSAIEEGWLLRELMQPFGLGLDELARRFDRSASYESSASRGLIDSPERENGLCRKCTLRPARHAWR